MGRRSFFSFSSSSSKICTRTPGLRGKNFCPKSSSIACLFRTACSINQPLLLCSRLIEFSSPFPRAIHQFSVQAWCSAASFVDYFSGMFQRILEPAAFSGGRFQSWRGCRQDPSIDWPGHVSMKYLLPFDFFFFGARVFALGLCGIDLQGFKKVHILIVWAPQISDMVYRI